MDLIGYTITQVWSLSHRKDEIMAPGSIRVWWVLEYEEKTYEKAKEHLDFLLEHDPESNPVLVPIYAKNEGWKL